MAWQRTIPFGYQMRQGIIEINCTEADAVRDIFTRYLQGESLQHIAEAIMAQNVRYHEGTENWNKNMVKRILENKQYLGDKQFPYIICRDTYTAAQLIKSKNTTYKQCIVNKELRNLMRCGECGSNMSRVRSKPKAKWTCGNPNCGHTVYISDKQLVSDVNSLLETLAHTPEILTPRIPQEPIPRGNAQRIANELTNALNRSTESIEYLRTLIFACAAERYNELPDGSLQHKVDKLHVQLESGERSETIQQELLKTAVRSIRIADYNTITLELVNGQCIGKEAAEE